MTVHTGPWDSTGPRFGRFGSLQRSHATAKYVELRSPTSRSPLARHASLATVHFGALFVTRDSPATPPFAARAATTSAVQTSVMGDRSVTINSAATAVPVPESTLASFLDRNIPVPTTRPPAPPAPSPQPNEHTGLRAACAAPPNQLRPRSPIKIHRLAKLLTSHPDQQFVQHITSGLEHGFNIGYDGARTNQQSRNLLTASAHPDFASDQLSESCRRGETAGPYPSTPFPVMRLSGIGVVPKKGNKLRLIHHLSSPRGDSVNDHIHRKFVNLQYITVDDTIQAIIKSGPGTYLSKVDIKSAFRICPVRRAWPLLGIAWNGEYFFDMVLPLASVQARQSSTLSPLAWSGFYATNFPSQSFSTTWITSCASQAAQPTWRVFS